MKKKATQWRRLYTFECKGCGRPKAQTVKYRVMVEKSCKLCRKAYIDRRQTSLFGMEVVVDPSLPPNTIKIVPKGADGVFNLPTETSYTLSSYAKPERPTD